VAAHGRLAEHNGFFAFLASANARCWNLSPN
jgi:hypothetical protein